MLLGKTTIGKGINISYYTQSYAKWLAYKRINGLLQSEVIRNTWEWAGIWHLSLS